MTYSKPISDFMDLLGDDKEESFILSKPQFAIEGLYRKTSTDPLASHIAFNQPLEDCLEDLSQLGFELQATSINADGIQDSLWAHPAGLIVCVESEIAEQLQTHHERGFFIFPQAPAVKAIHLHYEIFMGAGEAVKVDAHSWTQRGGRFGIDEFGGIRLQRDHFIESNNAFSFIGALESLQSFGILLPFESHNPNTSFSLPASFTDAAGTITLIQHPQSHWAQSPKGIAFKRLAKKIKQPGFELLLGQLPSPLAHSLGGGDHYEVESPYLPAQTFYRHNGFSPSEGKNGRIALEKHQFNYLYHLMDMQQASGIRFTSPTDDALHQHFLHLMTSIHQIPKGDSDTLIEDTTRIVSLTEQQALDQKTNLLLNALNHPISSATSDTGVFLLDALSCDLTNRDHVKFLLHALPQLPEDLLLTQLQKRNAQGFNFLGKICFSIESLNRYSKDEGVTPLLETLFSHLGQRYGSSIGIGFPSPEDAIGTFRHHFLDGTIHFDRHIKSLSAIFELCLQHHVSPLMPESEILAEIAFFEQHQAHTAISWLEQYQLDLITKKALETSMDHGSALKASLRL